MQKQLADLLHVADEQTLPVSGILQRIARGALHFRDRRRAILGNDNFVDPGWDLLLLLAANGDTVRGISCAEAARRSVIPPKVMERFAALLAGQGLVETFDTPNGKHASLTPHGSDTLARLIGSVGSSTLDHAINDLMTDPRAG